ncbi:hypothetical protein WS68_08375 [Burkholderia sp. TSV86]|nr:hypothetical protein WS68_08375 [Burkholderia sp. TSV86]
MPERCCWVKTEADAHYHDTEWGVPSHDDRYLFEMLMLEGAQAIGMVNDHETGCPRHTRCAALGKKIGKRRAAE